MSVIVIDPGHGGFDPGAVGNGLREKDITLSVSLALKPLLEKKGMTVFLTRDKDIAPRGAKTKGEELKARVDISNATNADFFLSIHCNAAVNPSAKGSEIFVFKDGGKIKSLAQRIVTNVSSLGFGLRNPSLKDGSGLYVISNTSSPAMLLEMGFISNAHDANLLKRTNDLAKKIADAFI